MSLLNQTQLAHIVKHTPDDFNEYYINKKIKVIILYKKVTYIEYTIWKYKIGQET